jgi:hypothetical protein
MTPSHAGCTFEPLYKVQPDNAFIRPVRAVHLEKTKKKLAKHLRTK